MVRLRKSGMSVRASERVTKNRDTGWNRREIPEGHARRFILRESYWRNVRKFEIITPCSLMCVNEGTQSGDGQISSRPARSVGYRIW